MLQHTGHKQIKNRYTATNKVCLEGVELNKTRRFYYNV